ncbi:hypothetical protein CEXT_382201 [Caerostris extrusa]|uniref:Uncharacterized protein n=1 Tax=Caerostris extrusa TaxID=172846 RepID=A0AAV4N6P0_CAEEX|nr:hypothetical protein CEXT_382201 [Caerostris extrusa]
MRPHWRESANAGALSQRGQATPAESEDGFSTNQGEARCSAPSIKIRCRKNLITHMNKSAPTNREGTSVISRKPTGHYSPHIRCCQSNRFPFPLCNGDNTQNT